MNEEEIVNLITENGKYDNDDICLLFLLNGKIDYLKYLIKMGITGKKFNTLFNKCCEYYELDCFIRTILYISMGIFEIEDINKNLESDNPIYFIDDYKNNIFFALDRYSFLQKDFKERLAIANRKNKR